MPHEQQCPLLEEWNKLSQALQFRELNCPPELVEHFKHTFFSGAFALYTRMMKMLDPEDKGEPTESELNFMKNVDAELTTYFKRLKHGKHS